MKIAIATGNPAKVDAVYAVFEGAYPQETIAIEQLRMPSGVPEQPLNDEIAAGAVTRAHAAQAACNADISVGIEAGLMPLPGSDRWLSVQACAIVDAQGRQSIGLGPGYELPSQIEAAVLSGLPLRDAFEQHLGVEDADRRGGIHYLSCGTIDRRELTMTAVRMALLPWCTEDGLNDNG